jgi:hypothetical protein
MAIQILPAKRTGFGDFVDALKPGLEQAFNIYLKKQLDEQQRQKTLKQTNQMFPGVMQEIPQTAETSMGQVPVKPNPKIPPQYQFNMEQAQKYPGLDFNAMTGGAEYKVPQPLAPTYIYNPSTEKVELMTLPTGEPVPPKAKVIVKPNDVAKQKFEVEQEEKNRKLKEKSDFVIQQAQDKLNTIAEVKKGIEKGYFGLYGVLPAVPGTEKYTWQSNIDKLLSGKMIELMTQMKEASKTGATGFGQLSEKEGQILRDASTALKRGLAPQEAQKLLTNMETILQKVVSGTQQPQGQGDFSTMTTEQLLERRRQLQGGG